MNQIHPIPPARRRLAGAGVLLIGLFAAYTLVGSWPGPEVRQATAAAVAEPAEVDPDAGCEVPLEPGEPSLAEWRSSAEQAGDAQTRGSDPTCLCTDVAGVSQPFQQDDAFRGNIYRMDAEVAQPPPLCEFTMDFDAPAGAVGTELCFYVLRCTSNCSAPNSVYEIIWTNPSPIFVDVAGIKTYSSGPITGVSFAPNEKFVLGVAWDTGSTAVLIQYHRDSRPYPDTSPEFGTIEGSFGENDTTCAVESPIALDRFTGGAYVQQICFEPEPGACCLSDDTCLDTLPSGGSMTFDTCVNMNGEFTNEGVTCAELDLLGGALGGCEWLTDHQGACCWDDLCEDFTDVPPLDFMNTFFCEYLGDTQGTTTEFFDGATCLSEICDPRGTCCGFGGDCHDYVTESDCSALYDGEWLDPFAHPNVTCDTVDCASNGACCFGLGDCDDQLEEFPCEVQGGTFLGAGRHCDPDGLICDPVTGACCSLVGCTDDTTQYECEVELGGTYQGDFLPCEFVDPADCPEMGACCDGSACQELDFDTCTNGGVPPARYFATVPCDPNPCLAGGIGACCVANECLETNIAECFALDGEFFGSPADCNSNLCPQVGACCTSNGGCEEGLTQAVCSNGGGTFAGVGVPCGWACNPGACCVGDSCVDGLVQLACLAVGGDFAGAFITCGDGTCADCNSNGVRDGTDIASDNSVDCNLNGNPDECEIPIFSTAPGGPFFCTTNCNPDCNTNGVPDECDVAFGGSQDCNFNAVPDECDILAGTSADSTTNGIPDECESDCNSNGVPDATDIAEATSLDCNGTSIPDECEHLAHGDFNADGMVDIDDFKEFPGCLGGPDAPASPAAPECAELCLTAFDFCRDGDVDVSDYGVIQNAVIQSGGLVIADCNLNGTPDDCDILAGTSEDCQPNGVPDECDIAAGTSADADTNGVPDECEQAATLESALPAHNKTLWRTANNFVRLTFGADLTVPGDNQLWMDMLDSNGAFGPSYSTSAVGGADFTVTVGTNGLGQPRTLDIRENGTVLSNRTWIAVRSGAWAGVQPFELHYMIQAGDVDNEGNVLIADVSSIIPNLGQPASAEERPDVDGDGNVLSADISTVVPLLGNVPVPKPSGHAP